MRNAGKFSLFSVAQKGLNFKGKVERRENSDLVNESGFKAAKNHRVQRNPVKT